MDNVFLKSDITVAKNKLSTNLRMSSVDPIQLLERVTLRVSKIIV